MIYFSFNWFQCRLKLENEHFYHSSTAFKIVTEITRDDGLNICEIMVIKYIWETFRSNNKIIIIVQYITPEDVAYVVRYN